jgi:uncharacterized membrane-anchored protein
MAERLVPATRAYQNAPGVSRARTITGEVSMRLVGRIVMTVSLISLAAVSAAAPEKPSIPWERGPMTGKLGDYAEIQVPEGFLFTGKKGTEKLLELTRNLVSGHELGAMVPADESPEGAWFVVFEFQDVGFVKDDEKNKIDPDALLKTIRQGTEEANQERRKRGWQTFTVAGWQRPPYYDPATHNLTWAIRGQSDSGVVSVNHSIRILGRRGTMNVDLVLDPSQYDRAVPRFESVMSTFRFQQGNRYADFVKGDKVAAYGLTALIVGGAGAVALKTGLLAKFWKVIVGLLFALKKLIIVVVLGVGAFFKRVFAWIRARLAPKDETVTDPSRGPGTPAA